jgi:hypothetical protein
MSRRTLESFQPAKVFAELTAERISAVAQAIGSVQAEGLDVDDFARAIADRWARGEINANQMRELIRKRYTR